MRFRTLSLLLIAMVLFVGCTAQNAVVETTAGGDATPETAAEEMHTEVPVAATTEAMTIPTDAPTATTAPEAVTVSEESGAACPNRSGLEATDPATVALASGDVQLVEFFAFW